MNVCFVYTLVHGHSPKRADRDSLTFEKEIIEYCHTVGIPTVYLFCRSFTNIDEDFEYQSSVLSAYAAGMHTCASRIKTICNVGLGISEQHLSFVFNTRRGDAIYVTHVNRFANKLSCASKALKHIYDNDVLLFSVTENLTYTNTGERPLQPNAFEKAIFHAKCKTKMSVLDYKIQRGDTLLESETEYGYRKVVERDTQGNTKRVSRVPDEMEQNAL